MKNKLILLIVVLLFASQAFAYFQIVEDDPIQTKELASKITPQILGLKPTTDNTEYATPTISDKTPIYDDAVPIETTENFRLSPLLIFVCCLSVGIWILYILLKRFKLITKIKQFVKKMPKDNFHILGYISVAMLVYAWLFVGILGYNVEYSFYTILRWIISIFSLCCAYRIYKTSPESPFILIAFLTILFNPITPVSFSKTLWLFIDFIAMCLFVKILFDSTQNECAKDLKEFEENKKICDICGSDNEVKYYQTSGYEEINGAKTYFSGGVNICKNCLEKCKPCPTCGKLLPTAEIKKYIGYRMKHPDFCEHLFAHEKINELKKKYNL